MNLFALLLAAKQAAQRRQVQQVALVGAHYQSHVGHEQHDQDLQKAQRRPGRHVIAQHQGEEISPQNAQDAADGRADQTCETGSPEAPFEHNNGNADDHPQPSVRTLR